MPTARLYVRYLEQDIPLVHWPTTIGGWRTEQADNGYVYMKYKGSDVGDRVMRKIIAGPTWIPPLSTPSKVSLGADTSTVVVSGWSTIPKWDRDLSAYGLVAGYFVIPGLGVM